MVIEFTQDFGKIKKGDVREFSRDISNISIKELKVAKIYKEEEKKKEVKPKK
jgi:hypothetical protein